MDVGSVRRKGGFSWSTADAQQRGQDDPSQLGDALVAVLNRGDRVALVFECPLSVPIPDVSEAGWTDLGRARTGEGNRSWSAGAGTGALATGLVQLTWVLHYLQLHADGDVRATTQISVLLAGAANLLVAEAMVTSDGKPEPVDGLQDHADALAAARRFEELLEVAACGEASSDVACAPQRALNLAATAALHAGVLIDLAELQQEVLVAKTRPALTQPEGDD
ncbi:hypothetical protein [Nocardioides acrostichi]|uniref:Uncharacterized protein n=1 Tax=Nocardioides acrostichi TaxID=2784339 RepID=A0A930V0P9_9ACTN|nr:hypothetical protein [Nocardioides acrostichi]MBF4161597.1 hypothetical protein [Nocardioides acrostichi]